MLDITTYILAKDFTTAIVNKRAGKEIQLYDYSGKLDPESLKELAESNSSSVNLDGKLYRLASITDTEYRYFNSVSHGDSIVVAMTELDINKETGDFVTRKLMIDDGPVEELRAEFEAHAADDIIHVSEADRMRGDDKVSAESVQVQGTDYSLRLYKN